MKAIVPPETPGITSQVHISNPFTHTPKYLITKKHKIKTIPAIYDFS